MTQTREDSSSRTGELVAAATVLAALERAVVLCIPGSPPGLTGSQGLSSASPVPTATPNPQGDRLRKEGRRLVPVVAISVTLLVIVGSFYATGYFSPNKSSPAPPQSFDEAEAAANSYAQGQSGGPWTLQSAFGLEYASSTPVSTNASGATCVNEVPFSSYPVDSAGVGTGRTPLWIFHYSDSAGAELEVVVNSGVASTGVLYPASTGCGDTTSYFLGLAAFDLIDSTTAVATADTGGGSAFLSAHQGAAMQDAIFQYPLGAHDAPEWVISYSVCLTDIGTPVIADAHPLQSEPYLDIFLNATSDTIIQTQDLSGPCG